MTIIDAVSWGRPGGNTKQSSRPWQHRKCSFPMFEEIVNPAAKLSPWRRVWVLSSTSPKRKQSSSTNFKVPSSALTSGKQFKHCQFHWWWWALSCLFPVHSRQINEPQVAQVVGHLPRVALGKLIYQLPWKYLKYLSHSTWLLPFKKSCFTYYSTYKHLTWPSSETW